MYFLTALSDLKNRKTFGYFRDKSEWLSRIDQRPEDFGRCYYSYLVIEKIEEGVEAITHEEHWFEWYGKDKAWISCDKPTEYRGITNFAF